MRSGASAQKEEDQQDRNRNTKQPEQNPSDFSRGAIRSNDNFHNGLLLSPRPGGLTADAHSYPSFSWKRANGWRPPDLRESASIRETGLFCDNPGKSLGREHGSANGKLHDEPRVQLVWQAMS